MLELKPETEALALRLAEAGQQSVDETIRDALEARKETLAQRSTVVAAPETVAARLAAIDSIIARVKRLPDLDPRSAQEIVDDVNEI